VGAAAATSPQVGHVAGGRSLPVLPGCDLQFAHRNSGKPYRIGHRSPCRVEARGLTTVSELQLSLSLTRFITPPTGMPEVHRYTGLAYSELLGDAHDVRGDGGGTVSRVAQCLGSLVYARWVAGGWRAGSRFAMGGVPRPAGLPGGRMEEKA
jgi:hypothetical protein